MNSKNLIFLICQIIPLLVFTKNPATCDTLKIYDDLINCYRNDSSLLLPFIPNSLQVLLELIRKLEDFRPTSIDIRYLSVHLLHNLRIDGIQRAPDAQQTESITPYHTNDKISTKFNVLLKLISNVPGKMNFTEILTHSELCILHKLISSTIEPNIRGDEHQTCQNSKYDEHTIPANRVFGTLVRPYIISHKISKCPIEMGVVRTYNYGTFAPGVIIASIAAGLQPQSVQLREIYPTLERTDDRFQNLETMERRDINHRIIKLLRSEDTIDNTFAANLAGDLAEVCVYQTPYYGTNLSIAASGHWNDTEYPIIRFLNEPNPLHWAITDSEILAGIDGQHLSKNIKHWVDRINRMKLSQILEMYYSSHGILNLLTENSSSRKRILMKSSLMMKAGGTKLNDYNPLEGDFQSPSNQPNYYDTERYGDSACERKNIFNRIPREKLKDETYNLAQILQYSVNSVTIEDDLLRKSCNMAVDKFFNYTLKLLNHLPKCKNIRRPNIDVTLILDGTRNRFDSLKLISFFTEIFDISKFSSRLAVIHGGSGEYLVRPTQSIVNVYDQLRNFTGQYPTGLSLSDSFSTIIHELERQKHDTLLSGKLSGLSQVIFVVSQSQEIRQDDFHDAKRLIDGSFRSHPDLYFLFLTNNQQTFLDLIQNDPDILLANRKKYSIVHNNHLKGQQFMADVLRPLRTIPKWLHLPSCNTIKPNSDDHQYDEVRRNEIEDYVGRYHSNLYRLNGQQLHGRQSVLRIKFKGTGYGTFTVCMEIESSNKECKSTQNLPDELIWFNNTRICDMADVNLCPDILFSVELDSSNVKCTEHSCRYPDDVRYYILLENDSCSGGSTGLLNAIVNVYYVILVAILCVQL